MNTEDFRVELVEWPTEKDWDRVRERALVTMGLTKIKTPTTEDFICKILEARHSPIRCMMFSFYLEVPSWLATHFSRHVHAQPYIATQRNDRQNKYDRNEAPQGTIVKMRWDINAEELQIVMNKRLCGQASPEAQHVARMMRDVVIEKCPWMQHVMVPMCVYHGGVCHELKSCKEK